MKIYFVSNIILVALLSCNTAIAQESIGLSVGDSLPIVNIPKVINIKSKISTADYKNQLLIIDFWSTGCGTCVESLPKMEALERQFEGSLKILPVTMEKKEHIITFLKNNKYTRNLKGPFVVEDKFFHNLFKHKYIPHEIWIYKGKIVGITSLDYVDVENIIKVLKSKPMEWPIKNDFYKFDSKKTLFMPDSNQIDIHSTYLEYVAISDFRAEVNSPIWLTGGSGIIRDTLKKTIRSYFLNQPILNSYLNCFLRTGVFRNLIKPPFNGIQPNQIIWEVSNKSKYIFEKGEGVYQQNWLITNGICFESLQSDIGQNDKQINETIISDLNRLLRLNVRWEKRNEKVLVLKKIAVGEVDSIKKEISSEYYDLHSICYYLNEESENPYVFNESNEKYKKIPLKISSWKNISSVRNALQTAGFDLIEEFRDVDKLIFSEINGGNVVDSEMQRKAFKRKKDNANVDTISAEDNALFLNTNLKKTGVQRLSSGLQYVVIKEGTGSLPLPKSKVLLNFEGRLINGRIFDSSFDHGLPVILAVDKVIVGWNQALQLMKEGSEWELYIPASLAYGSHTGHGIVPPNSTLIFRIELLKVLPINQ